MSLGPGKYDADLSLALDAIRAREPRVMGGCLIVFALPGEPASVGGFASQLTLEATLSLPGVLRSMADQIEETHRRGRL